MGRRAVIISNPGAGWRHPRGRALPRMLQALRARGVDAAARVTAGPDDATRLAREAAAAGVDVVVAHGGDGTVNEVVQALVGGSTALGVWPAGTSNALAQEIGLPRRLDALADILAGGRTRRVSVGRAGDRYFILMAGIGLDAAALRRVSSRLKRVAGAAAYWVAALRELIGPGPGRFVVEIEGRAYGATFAVVANAATYGGGLRFAPRARMDDDLLDVCLIDEARRSRLPRYLAAARTGSHLALPGVTYLQARRLRARGEGAHWVHVDGEALRPLPITFECVPSAVSLVVPG